MRGASSAELEARLYGRQDACRYAEHILGSFGSFTGGPNATNSSATNATDLNGNPRIAARLRRYWRV